MRLKVVLEKGEDGYIAASVPSLLGCHSQGRNKAEAVKNIREAIELYLQPDPKTVRPSKHHQVLTLAI